MQAGRYIIIIYNNISWNISNACLQVLDFVAWAIGRKYETGEQEYYDLIKGRIVSETVIPK